MDIRKLQRAIVDGLEDVKAQHIAVFNTEHLSPLFERVVVATGASNRQTKALAASVRDAVRSTGRPRPLTVSRTLEASALVWRLLVPEATITRSKSGDRCSVLKTRMSCAFTSSRPSTMARCSLRMSIQCGGLPR